MTGATREPLVGLAERLREPFHVSRSSDGTRQWFSARDAAAGVTIPSDSREAAYNMVASLNLSVQHAVTTALEEQSRRVAELEARERRLLKDLADALPDEIDLFRVIRDAKARGYAASAQAAYTKIAPLEAALRARTALSPSYTVEKP